MLRATLFKGVLTADPLVFTEECCGIIFEMGVPAEYNACPSESESWFEVLDVSNGVDGNKQLDAPVALTVLSAGEALYKFDEDAWVKHTTDPDWVVMVTDDSDVII